MTFDVVALDLIERGCWLFPCKRGGKEPAFDGWQELATRDMDTVLAWINSGFNLGVFTGKFGDDAALLVVDVDRKNGKDGDVALFKLSMEGLDLPPTFEVRTASGGSHLFYRVQEPVKQGAGVLGTGVDIRSRGGYVVSAGSSLGDGSYTVSADVPVADAPVWLIDRCVNRTGGDVKPETSAPLRIDRAAAAVDVRAFLQSAPVAIEYNGGNDAALRVAARCKDFCDDGQLILDIMMEEGGWNSRCLPPWSYAELSRIVSNAFAYGQNAPGARAASYSEVGSVDYILDSADNRGDVRWIVEGLIPPGVTLFYGEPKAGKGWAVMNLAAAIATGRRFLDNDLYYTHQTGALVITYEEDYRLLRDRIEMLEIPRGTPIVFRTQWPQFTNDPRDPAGGQAKLLEFFQAHPEFRLLVIDPWARVKPNQDSRRTSNAFDLDYAAFTPIVDFAEKHDISIIIVHHTKKNKDKDGNWQLDVNGSTAITAAVAAVGYLTKGTEASRKRRLRMVGRQFSEEPDIKMLLDLDGRLLETDDLTRVVTPFMTYVREALEEGMSTVNDIRRHIRLRYPGLSIEGSRVSGMLRSMQSRNEVRRVDRGTWELLARRNGTDVFTPRSGSTPDVFAS